MSKLALFVFAASLWVWSGCSGENPIQGTPCRTDQDCNGGLCQAGVCTGNGATDVAGNDDADAALDIAEDGVAEAGDDAPTETGDDDPVIDPIESDGEEEPPVNACGGTAVLEGEPGDSCGPCEDGEYICDGADAVQCDSATPANVCGGCGPLPGIPGAPCGECADGQWVCEDGDMVCSCSVVEPDGTCAAPFPIDLGDVELVNLCGQGDDEDQIQGQIDCQDHTSRGEEVVFVFELEATTNVVIDLRDEDDSAAIDTVVYLRSTCGEAETQIICSDDVPCELSDVEAPCTGAVQVRQSHIETELEAGTYFLIADSFNYSQSGVGFGCGTVRVSLSD